MPKTVPDCHVLKKKRFQNGSIGDVKYGDGTTVSEAAGYA